MTRLKRPSKKGYVLSGSGSQVILFHGYTGSPYDLSVLADYLHKRDCHVVVPLLKGHGTKPQDLLQVTAQDWLDQASDAIAACDAHKPIVLGGLSMGALLAILRAKDHPSIRALLLFSPALHLDLVARITIASAQRGLLDKKISLPKLSGGSDINDPEAKAKTPSYKEMPIGGLLEFNQLRLLAIDAIASINCPTFVAFGSLDSAIDAKESHNTLITHLQASCFSRFYDNSKHVVTLDYDREQLAHDVWYFLNHHV